MRKPSPNESTVGRRNHSNCVLNSVREGTIARHPTCAIILEIPKVLQATNASPRIISNWELTSPGIFKDRNRASEEAPVWKFSSRIARSEEHTSELQSRFDLV